MAFDLLPAGCDSGDILFVNADFSRNALGVATEVNDLLGLTRLATYVTAQGFTPTLLDTSGQAAGTDGVTRLTTQLHMLAPRFRVLGFHLTSWNISTTLAVIATLPKSTRLLFGGPLASGCPRDVVEKINTLGFAHIGVIAGFGELLTAAALATDDWCTIAALHTRDNVGTLQRPTTDEIATFPLVDPTYSPFLQKVYRPVLERGELGERAMGEVFRAFGLDVNQGCPFDCAYCSLPAFGRSMTEYAPIRVVQEMTKLGEECGVFSFTFTNSNLLFTRRAWLVDFLDELEQTAVAKWATWTGYNHPYTLNLLSAEDFARMRKCGCEEIVVGVQSVDPVVARLFHRPENSWELLKSIREKTRVCGQSLVIDYITGVPGEDLQLIEEFYAWCEQNDVECRSFQLKIYPETELAHIAPDWNATHELVPITGESAGELDGFAVVPRETLPTHFVKAEEQLRVANARITTTRPVRIGSTYVPTAEAARALLSELPWQTTIPANVRKMQTILLREMLSGRKSAVKTSAPAAEPSVSEAMRAVVLADENSPPMLRAMQARFKKEMGEKAFEELRKKFGTTGV